MVSRFIRLIEYIGLELRGDASVGDLGVSVARKAALRFWRGAHASLS
jgi:hypothetical protein